MQAINPATGDIVAEYTDHPPEETLRRLERSESAFAAWRQRPMADRARLIREASRIIRHRASALGRLMAIEMGKPIAAGEQEIEKCADCFEHFSEHAPDYLADRPASTDADRTFVRFDPLGPVLAIMPWNFPFWQVVRFAAPALMAGNVALLKHAENVPGCALAIEQVFTDAGFPPGVFQTLLIDRQHAEAVIRHSAVRAVTLTGSERAGQSVAATAGSVLKKTVLELGGSDAFIVLSDADIPAVAAKAAEARCINSGQSCIAAKRFIVESPAYDAFVEAMTHAMQARRMGDPLDRQMQIGPQARGDLRENLHRQVLDTRSQGGLLTTGGELPAGPGFFYPPTVLANVMPGMAAFDEETFGPVAAIVRAADVDDAVRLANVSRYGLGASVWTNDADRAEQLAGRIDAGAVFVNGIVKSDSRVPFGGIKSSGYGRELSAFGIHEFVNIKTVWVKRGAGSEGGAADAE
jgi:succinate-semialdehyde dehydrogenase/glutarate-semialdehyde dehydrogenase